MRDDSLSAPLLLSLALHVVIVLCGAALVQKNPSRSSHLLPVALYDLPRPELPRPETPEPRKKVEAVREPRRPPPEPAPVKKPPMPKPAETREIKPPSKGETAELIPPMPLPAPPPPPGLFPEDLAKAPEIEPAAPSESPAPPPDFSTRGTQGGGGGSEAGAGNLFGKGDVGVVPGSGTAGGGGGTAASGLGQGSGAPGLPSPTGPIRTDREAKPLKTVKASYPPLALRAGLESDVSLRIEVDPAGKVTKAEVIKSGGAGFDEEALRAVKQSRFQPAQRDGLNVAAEFVYIYRFRLAK